MTLPLIPLAEMRFDPTLAEATLERGHEPRDGRILKYSADQPRDDRGRWTSGGSADTVSMRPSVWQSPRDVLPGPSQYVAPSELEARLEAALPGVRTLLPGATMSTLVGLVNAAEKFAAAHPDLRGRVAGIGFRNLPPAVMARTIWTEDPRTGDVSKATILLSPYYFGRGSSDRAEVSQVRNITGDWHVPQEVGKEELIAHEFGHVFDSQRWAVASLGKLAAGPFGAVSGYGRTSPTENFAEMYVQYHYGSPDTWHEATRAAVDAMGWPVPAIAKYSESQPRVPAGSPEGGEFAGTDEADRAFDRATVTIGERPAQGGLLRPSDISAVAETISRNTAAFEEAGGTIEVRSTTEQRLRAINTWKEMDTAGVFDRREDGPYFTLNAARGSGVIVNLAWDGEVLAGAHSFTPRLTPADDSKVGGRAMGYGIIGTTGTTDGTGSALVGQFIRQAAGGGYGIVISPTDEAKPFWTKMGMRSLGWRDWGMTAVDVRQVAAALDGIRKVEFFTEDGVVHPIRGSEGYDDSLAGGSAGPEPRRPTIAEASAAAAGVPTARPAYIDDKGHFLTESARIAAAKAIQRGVDKFQAQGGSVVYAPGYPWVNDAYQAYDDMAEAEVFSRYDTGPRFVASALEEPEVNVAWGNSDGTMLAGAHGYTVSDDPAELQVVGGTEILGHGIIGTTGTTEGTGSALVAQYIRDASERDAGLVIAPVFDARDFWAKMGFSPMPHLAAGQWGMTAADAADIAGRLR